MSRLRFAGTMTLALMLAGCAGDPPGDFGMPSAVYPAGHASLPQVRDNGGPVQSAPVFYLVTVAGNPLTAPLSDFLAKLGTSSDWDAALGSYGVGPAFFGGAVTIAPWAATIGHDTIPAMLDAMLDGTHPEYGAPSLDSSYVVVLPAGVTIQNPFGRSCDDFGGYHEAFAISAGPFAGTEVTYSAIPRCSPDGSGLSSTQLDELTYVISHELAETASNPLDTTGRPAWDAFGPADLAWNLFAGGEIADICATLAPALRPADLGYLVAPVWSNRAAAASHNPCQPSVGPYFAAAPVLPDTVSVSLSECVPTAIIPVGSSRTIELDIFSDGPTAGPIQIRAEEAAPPSGPAGNLGFALDRASGVNGEKVHLTVHVRSAGTGWGLGNVELFFVTATQGGTKRLWPVLVANDRPQGQG